MVYKHELVSHIDFKNYDYCIILSVYNIFLDILYSMKIKPLFIFALCTFCATAQINTPETILTDTVDFFTQTNDAAVSPQNKVNAFLNILIPGLGFYRIGDKTRAFVYFTADAFGALSTLVSYRISARALFDSKSYASLYAHTRSQRSLRDYYWTVIGNENFKDYRKYNEVMKLNGDKSLYYLNPEDIWEWESDEAQKNYRQIRQRYNYYRIYGSLFLGTLLLNRIISFIDFRVTSKRKVNYSNRTISLYHSGSLFTAQKYVSLEVFGYF